MNYMSISPTASSSSSNAVISDDDDEKKSADQEQMSQVTHGKKAANASFCVFLSLLLS